MSYTKVGWANGTAPYINADNLKHMDDQIYENSQNGNIPIGIGMDFYGTTVPTGWMFADGSAISRETYSELFAIIGTTYGTGDGSTTFNLPDKRERVSVMYKSESTMGTAGATFGTLGAKGGEDKHALIVDEIPSHTHNYDKTSANTANDFNRTFNNTAVTGISFNATQSSATGGGQSHNNLQPYLVCNYIIKVK